MLLSRMNASSLDGLADRKPVTLYKSDREGQISSDIIYIWNLIKNDMEERIYTTNIFTDFEITFTVTKGEMKGEG